MTPSPIVCLGQPIYESTPAEAHTAMLRLVAHSVAAGLDIRFRYVEGSRIENARTALTQWALDEGASHLFMVDDDMVPPADALVRLLAHRVPVVGGYVQCRVSTYPPPPEALRLDNNGQLRHVFPIGLERVFFVGTGCILIETEVLRSLGSEWFRSSPDSAGEDLHFAKRCLEAGIPVYVDGDVSCGHVYRLTFYPPDASDAAAMRPYSWPVLTSMDETVRSDPRWSI